MSHKCSPIEFEKQFQDHLAAFGLADDWQRGDALKQVLDFLRRVSYFSVTRGEVTTRNNPMVEVRGQFSLAKRLPDLVQIDLANLWCESTAGTARAFHAFSRTAEGFDMCMLAVFGSTVVTCTLQVVGTH